MIYTLSIGNDIKFSVLDLLRNIGMGIINIIYDTIDVLYNVAYKINSLDMIEMLKNIGNSPFTKIFNSFIILAFALLFLFAVWKVTFRIFDADEQEQPLSSLIKEIFKCGFLIFLVSLIFSQSMNISINLSNTIYNNFQTSTSTIGDNMKTAYLTVNESCYYDENTSYHKDKNKVDTENVKNLKEQIGSYASIPDSVSTVKDFTPLIRNGTLTATNISDSGAFNLTCQIYKPGIRNDGEDYFFNFNWVFGIVIGAVFLFAIAFSVIMLGRRQLEIAFLMLISPLIFATSIGRKEQRSALYQQLTSLVLQAGAVLLLIGLTSLMFNAIQNSSDINSLPYFTKTVAQSVLYLGCAMMLLTGSTTLNRFIGENVSANSGRDSLMAMKGLLGGMVGGGMATFGAIKGATQTGKGLAQMGNATRLGLAGLSNGGMHDRTVKSMASKMQKAQNKITKGQENKQAGNGLATKLKGMYQEYSGNKKMDSLNKKWDYDNNRVQSGYFKGGFDTAKTGLGNIAHSFMGYRHYPNSFGNLKSVRKPPIQSYKNDGDKL
mgnify:CR=1 FL=1